VTGAFTSKTKAANTPQQVIYSLRKLVHSMHSKTSHLTDYFSPHESSGVYYYCPYSIHPGAAYCRLQNELSLSKNSVEPVLCKSGEYLNSESRCELIPTGYYNPDLESFNVYYKCPEGTTSLTGSTSCQVKKLEEHTAQLQSASISRKLQGGNPNLTPTPQNCPAGNYNDYFKGFFVSGYFCSPVSKGKCLFYLHFTFSLWVMNIS
jgi:hypothetical protein